MAISFKTLWKNDTPKNFTEIFMFNGWKFKVHIEHTNGTPLGFNTNCALYIMIENGTFAKVTDSEECDIQYTNCYFYGDTSKELCKIAEFNKTYVESFKDFIKKVYA